MTAAEVSSGLFTSHTNRFLLVFCRLVQTYSVSPASQWMLFILFAPLSIAVFQSCPSEVLVFLCADMVGDVPSLPATEDLLIPTVVASSYIFSMPGGSQKRPGMVDDSPPLSPFISLPVSPPFFQRNGANVQPCGQLTGRLGPYANFMMAETVVCSGRCKNDVSFGAALFLTLICAELLMINRVRVCF